MLLLISWAAVLRATETDREASAARKRKFAVARVVDVQEDDGEAQDWTEGRRIGQQQLEVEILTGEWKGVRLETINYLTILIYGCIFITSRYCSFSNYVIVRKCFAW